MTTVLHIIPILSSGGAARALIATAKYSARQGKFQHRVCSLLRGAPEAVALAKAAGLAVLEAPDRDTILREMTAADIVQVNWWNNPELQTLLHADLPPMRLLMWYHVAGNGTPQIITPELVNFADLNIPTNPWTYRELPVFRDLPAAEREQRVAMVIDAADFERVQGIKLRKHSHFNIGYIGSVDFVKMHRNFVPMSAAIQVPDVRFIVCGHGIEKQLMEQARQLGAAERFDFRGYVSEIKSVIESFDAYGYPLCEDTYASGELNLQEVMYAGVPPVVFPHGGLKGLVEHNKTGLVVHGESEYREAIEHLYHHPEERARLGGAAREHARAHFGAENAARILNPLYRRLMSSQKRQRLWACRPDRPLLVQPISILDVVETPDSAAGARMFIESLGAAGKDFLTSLISLDVPALWVADQAIANASLLLRSVSSGGVLNYRDAHPNDGFLRLWSGLVLQQEGKFTEALLEFSKAIDLGCDHWRVGWYIAQTAEQSGERALAEQAAGAVLQIVPDFAPAKKLLSPAFKSAPAAAIPPASLSDCLQQADAHFNRGNLAGATAVLRHGVVLDPNAAEVRIALGSLLYQQGDFAEAYEQFLATAKLQPTNTAVQVKLAASAIKLDRFTDFENALRLAFQFEPENLDALKLLAGLNFQTGRHADAAHTFHRILQQVPNDEESLLCLGKCFFETGDLESTQLVFEQVLKNNPGHSLAQENLVVVKRKLAETRTPLQTVPSVSSGKSSSDTAQNVAKPDRQEVGPAIIVTRPWPKISIVTPSFNQGQFLEECLDSILSQNYPNLEYIVMDGGSRDGSIEIIKKHAMHLAHWQSQPDGGQYQAIQAGFERSGGEIMFWLNSDDKLHPGSLDVVAEVFNQLPNVEWIMGRPTAWDEAGLPKELSPELPQWSREKYLAREFNKGFIQQESTFWRRRVWDKAGGCLDAQLKLAADFELWARFFRFAQLHVVDAILGGFRYHSAQKTATLMREYEAEVEEIIGRETRLLERSTDTLLPAPAPLDIATLNRAASRITPENFSYFTYSKRPHFGFFRDHDLALYGRRIDPAQCDLKVYQDLLVYTFIRDNIAPGSRILEVGGGDSRVLKALKHDYECWNLDKLEGVGNGLTAVDATGYRLVKDYLGNFSGELPNSYFDFVFSVSVFEHLEQSQENFRSVCLDIDRVMKTGALSLHCMDVVQQKEVRANKVLPFIFENVRTANKPIPLVQLKMDPHTFCMSEEAYNHGWKNITKKSYQDFGQPLSYNLLWKKTDEPILEILKDGQPEPALSEPLVSVVVSTYAAEKFIRACLEDLEVQTIAEKLEIIVIDSGSPQNERAIVEEFQQRYNNISYHRTERETLYAAWNRAIGLARGKYIANANCDDAHRADALEKLVAALEAHPEADLAYGDYYTTTVPNSSFANPSILRHVVHPSYHPATVMMYCVTGCHPMWRKTVFDKLGLFDPTYTAPGDYEFLFRFVQAGLRAVRVPQPLSLFFQNAEGLSWKSAAQTKREGDRILGKYRSQMPIERLFKVNPSDAASVSQAWVALGNLAVQHEIPWLSNFVQDLPYARFCFEQALKTDSRNVSAGKNLVITRMLQQKSPDDLGFLEYFPAEMAKELRCEIKRGQLQLAPAVMPPAVEPLEFGEQAVTRVVPNFAILPPFVEEGLGDGEQTPSPRPSLSVRLAGSFLNHGRQASDALNLALPLTSRINLATLDQSAPYSYSFDVNLPEAVRAVLRATQSKFNFFLGGIGISHRAVDELNRVQGVNYHIGRTMFEADHLPTDWVRACNQMDELWVPSRFNAEVFASSGVEGDKLVVIPGAVNHREFDPTQHTPLPLPNRAAFNFLAVFEWCTRKGWDILIASYLREFSVDDDVCLYLRTSLSQKSEAEARAAIEQQIREFTKALNLGDKKLPRVEILTGEIRLADMPKIYRAADCVVAPSRGEAWGRVAHEAMMMALPVIATNWGGHTHFMNADTAYPLDYELVPATNLELDQWQYHGQRWANPSETHLRELLRHVQRSPDEARAKGAKARAHVQTHFSSEAVADQVVARLEIIQEKLTKPSCPPAKTRDAAIPQSAVGNRQSLNVALEGSFLDFGSLSHVNRELTRQLARQPKLSLTCVSKNVVPPELAKHKLLVDTARRLKYPAPKNSQVTIRHAWPPNWERPASGAWVLIQPWEFGVLPEEWTIRLGSVDEVWVYSDYVRRVYVDSGVDPAKVKIVPLGIDPEKFKPGLQPFKLATAKSFKFLFVGGTIHRKGPDLVLKAYLENFTAADDACLVIKDYGGQSVYAGQTFESQIRAAQAQPNAPEILYLNEELAPEALPGLYAACDCLVHPYRGEGFGLPVLEAMACGLPVVVTGGGSTDDFATDEVAYRIPALKKEFGSAVSGLKLVRDGWLLEPDLAALAARMKWVVANHGETRTTGRAASELVRREWTWERAAQIAAQRIQGLIARRGAKSGEAPECSSKPITLPPVAKIGHLGEARELFRQGKLVPAWNKTVATLNVRPFHPEALLLLGEIAQTAGHSKQAKEFAEHARTLAPKWKPAQHFLKSTSSKGQVEVELPELPLSLYTTRGASRLTVCLITKNEQRFLGQCLESVRDLARQIVVVDTGSTDGTCDIAIRYGAELHLFDWCDDFGAARNAALERAVGDWVLFLDADEELLPGQRDALLQAMQDSGAIAYRLPMIEEGREDEGVSYVPRLFRNAPGLFYVGRVHEQVFSSVEVRRAEWGLENKLSTVQLLHHGYTKDMVKSRDKIARNLRLLQKALEEMPGEANLLMNLGLELVNAGRFRGGLEQYEAAFRALSALPVEEVIPELRETLLTQFCTHLLTVKNYAEIARVQRSSLAKAGGLSASLHWLFGLACIESKNFAEGAEQMRQCLAKRNKAALSPVNKNILKAGPSHCLAVCLTALKQTTAADEAFRAAVEADPSSSVVQFDYARFLAENGHEVEALKWVHQLSNSDPFDAMIWQFGSHVALSKPAFLEFACDWTREAVKLFPAHCGIAQQRAQALLLNGQPDGALPLWKQFGVASNPSHRAALIICETLLNQPLEPAPAEIAERVEQEFVTWYRRLLAANAGKVIQALNQRTELLRRVVPAAVHMLETARAEANAVPVP